jgi:hypothetical protein
MNTEKPEPLPHIDDVHDLDESDLACLSEIKKVLAKHDKLLRFGVSLLHDHFHVADDELLLETCDTENRTLMIRPVKRVDIPQAKMMPTNWRLDTDEILLGCTRTCAYSQSSDGSWYHSGTTHSSSDIGGVVEPISDLPSTTS